MDAIEQTNAHAAMAGVLDGVLGDQIEANRYAARRADGIREAIAYARDHGWVYTDLTSSAGEQAAESAVLLELSSRLQLSETHLTALARTAADARQHVPWLWQAARDGFAPMALVEATITAIARLRPAVDATMEELEAAHARVLMVDEQTSQWVLSLTPVAFRRCLTALVSRLDPRPAATRHTDALAERRVIVEDADDEMAWLSILLPRVDAIAAKARLNSTAKHLQKDEREGRNRDQIRADLASAWLRGEGTAAAVQTKVYVTVPVGLLAGTTADEDGRCTLCGGTGHPEQARLIGDGPINPLTAAQLFLDAKAFHRIVVDPLRSAVVDMDRRTYRPTQAQRDWLVLQHGTCSRDGCTRLAIDADIDHEIPWSQGGPTDRKRLRPLCPPDHARRHRTRLRYRSRADGSVQVVTPTGHATAQAPPF